MEAMEERLLDLVKNIIIAGGESTELRLRNRNRNPRENIEREELSRLKDSFLCMRGILMDISRKFMEGTTKLIRDGNMHQIHNIVSILNKVTEMERIRIIKGVEIRDITIKIRATMKLKKTTEGIL